MTTRPARLTELASCAGCAAKAGAAQLAEVLRLLADRPTPQSERLLVGLVAPDDAAVYRLNEEQALVATADFFPPLIDDPYAYGAVAAANALSDVYAMGGEAVIALNIAAFPSDLGAETIAQILRGGADKVEEAGAVIAGGHTIIDAEPKYGLCAIGLVHPDAIFTKGGARAGDLLYLTKPLGTGLITTAAKHNEADPAHLRTAIESMTALNRHPAHLARAAGARALTDVTGFGILGHGIEIAAASAVALEFEASRLPLLPGALDYAARGVTNAGAGRNEAFVKEQAAIENDVPAELRRVLYDPQTSGGLLFAIAPDRAREAERLFAQAGLALWRIGVAKEGAGVVVKP